MKKKKNRIVRFRHKIWFKILRFLCAPIIMIKFKYKYKKFKGNKKKPYLILCNHTHDLDPIFIGLCFNFPIYYMASEQIFNLGFVSKLLKHIFRPIPKSKSVADINAIKEVKRITTEGGSIGMFVEGNTSYNGENPYTPSTVTKLIKHLKIPVILCNAHGFYLSRPRWSFYKRKGPTYSVIKRVLQPEDYANMSDDELYQLILQELYVNCYQDQLINHYHYKGKRLAEGIERLLVVCPVCGKVQGIISKDNHLSCHNCGASADYSEEGFLANNSFPADNLIDLDRMQKEKFVKHLNEVGLDTIIENKAVAWLSVLPKRINLGDCNVSIDKDGFNLKFIDHTLHFDYDDIYQICIQEKRALIIYLHDQMVYFVKGDLAFQPYLYLMIFQYYKLSDVGTADINETVKKLGI